MQEPRQLNTGVKSSMPEKMALGNWWQWPTFKYFQQSWLLSVLGNQNLRLGAFFCMVLGAGLFLAGVSAVLGSGGLALGSMITLFGGGALLMAGGTACYNAIGFFAPKDPTDTPPLASTITP